MTALENLHHSSRPADFSDTPGIRQRAHLAAWKDCRSLARPGGSFADHEHGDTGLPVPPERKLATRGGQRGIQEFSPSGPFGAGAAGPTEGLAQGHQRHLPGWRRCSSPLFWGGLGESRRRRRGAGRRGWGAGDRGRGRGGGSGARLQAAPTPAPAAPARPPYPRFYLPPSPGAARGAGLCLPRPGAGPPQAGGGCCCRWIPSPDAGSGTRWRMLSSPCSSNVLKLLSSLLTLLNVCARAHSPCKKYRREMTRVSLIYLIVLNQ